MSSDPEEENKAKKEFQRLKTLPVRTIIIIITIIVTPIREKKRENKKIQIKNILIIKKRYNFNSLFMLKNRKKTQRLTNMTTIAIIRTAI